GDERGAECQPHVYCHLHTDLHGRGWHHLRQRDGHRGAQTEPDVKRLAYFCHGGSGRDFNVVCYECHLLYRPLDGVEGDERGAECQPHVHCHLHAHVHGRGWLRLRQHDGHRGA